MKRVTPVNPNLAAKARHRLQAWYRSQIGKRTSNEWANLSGLIGVTFKPHGHTSSFAADLFRPVGTTVVVVVVYDQESQSASFSGFLGHLQPNGALTYGLAERQFFYNTATACLSGLCSRRNPDLLETLLRLDSSCQRHASDIGALRAMPRLPRLWLAFAPGQCPAYEVTPALHRAAATRLGVSVKQFDRQPSQLVDELLRVTWQSLWIAADAPDNPTGLALVEADYCTHAYCALRAYEDFRELVGVHTWNPASELPVLRRRNPAGPILAEYGIDPCLGFDSLLQPLVDNLELRMRNLLGSASIQFSQEDLYDALVHPTEPLTSSTAALPQLRRRLTSYWSNCATDDDLRRAARNPNSALFASGASRVQVLRRPISLKLGTRYLQRRTIIDWEPRPWDSRSPADEAQQIGLEIA